MSTIGPPIWPQANSTPAGGARPPAESARAAAQKAFFEAALGRTSAPAQPSAPTAPARVAQAAQPVMHATPLRSIRDDEPPARIPRPGTFLNILV